VTYEGECLWLNENKNENNNFAKAQIWKMCVDDCFFIMNSPDRIVPSIEMNNLGILKFPNIPIEYAKGVKFSSSLFLILL
jgi:hypothetical protein